jgi:hypothetical protein
VQKAIHAKTFDFLFLFKLQTVLMLLILQILSFIASDVLLPLPFKKKMFLPNSKHFFCSIKFTFHFREVVLEINIECKQTKITFLKGKPNTYLHYSLYQEVGLNSTDCQIQNEEGEDVKLDVDRADFKI